MVLSRTFQLRCFVLSGWLFMPPPSSPFTPGHQPRDVEASTQGTRGNLAASLQGHALMVLRTVEKAASHLPSSRSRLALETSSPFHGLETTIHALALCCSLLSVIHTYLSGPLRLACSPVPSTPFSMPPYHAPRDLFLLLTMFSGFWFFLLR